MTARTIDNAPFEVRVAGGVALSLWLTGAREADVRIVTAHLSATRRLLAGLTTIRDQDGVDLVLDPHRSVRMASALLNGEDIREWAQAA